jgi:hypothetical protein
MKGYSDIPVEAKTKYTTYAESHPKSYISVLIVRNGKRPSADIKNRNNFNGLDESLKKYERENP